MLTGELKSLENKWNTNGEDIYLLLIDVEKRR